MAQGQQPITKRFFTWAECFTTTAETPVNTRFVNADGKSIMDLLAEEGSDIVAFYQAKGDIHAFLTKHNAELDDFKWDSPFGVLSISQALAKINANEIKIPIGGRSQLWSLERMLCFKGNTYAELFVSTGTIVYGRMREMANELSVKKLALSICLATFGLTYATYYASIGFWGLFAQDRGNSITIGSKTTDHTNGTSTVLSQMVIEHSLEAGLPAWRDEYANFLSENDSALTKAKGDVQSYLSNYGAGMAGNHWTAIEQRIALIEASQGRSGVTTEAISNFFGVVKNGLPLNPQSCAEIAANPSITRLGEKYSMGLYAGALDEQVAIDTLASMASSWRNTGKIEMPVRSQMLGNVEVSELIGRLNHVGSMLSDGSVSPCAIAPVVGVNPMASGWTKNYTLISMLVRTPLVNGDASVSMRLYAFVNDESDKPLKVFEAKVVNERNDLGARIAKSVKEFNTDGVEGFAEYKAFLQSTPRKMLISKSSFNTWIKEGEFPKTIPVVSLEEFVMQRKKGSNIAAPVVAYELDGAVTKYLVSTVSRDGNKFKRSLFSVYNTGEERGIVGFNCESCEAGVKGLEFFDFSSLQETSEDFRNELLDTPFGNPDVNAPDEAMIVINWLQKTGLIKDDGDFDSKIATLEENLLRLAISDRFEKKQDKLSLIDSELIFQKISEAGFISKEDDASVFMDNLANKISSVIADDADMDMNSFASYVVSSIPTLGEGKELSEKDKEVIKAISFDVVGQMLDLSKPDIKKLLSNEFNPESEINRIKLSYQVADFASGKVGVGVILESAYNRARIKDRVLGRLFYDEFKSAVCYSFEVPDESCTRIIDTQRKTDFVKGQ